MMVCFFLQHDGWLSTDDDDDEFDQFVICDAFEAHFFDHAHYITWVLLSLVVYGWYAITTEKQPFFIERDDGSLK